MNMNGVADEIKRTPFQTEIENAYSPLEKKRREAHRQEWRQRHGFLQKEDGLSESDLEWLDSELYEHLPRVDDRGNPTPCTDEDRHIPIEMKLVFVLNYHMSVAPMSWWKTYFEMLQKNANS